jgi:hypothetical protein
MHTSVASDDVTEVPNSSELGESQLAHNHTPAMQKRQDRDSKYIDMW